MAKTTRRRRNGKVIRTKPIYKKVLTKEANILIKQGDANEIYNSYGKVKKKYTQVNKIYP